ncbi:hypothetical protein TFKS16_1470 [Tannerella forsythia KS16]|uniref:Uncharacterized protein n=1 Tax=Tannerella forsythia (strain ATCC 43037 / JCM 10827 / CCUG 21028 A / KCTC 5666 / FDC 338) TaxID=203275 RepID=G8UMM3_TANFA|nr:hypothetical protein BFO_1669 [Tannerella forsythia 92A2]BAR49036.1 hypothetical protein TF3313_1522 [Tannerella forsythia 3313]BAR51723.1 hypothetical protein TFKS16_1470 [Tannerella forsythia KS16]
MNFFNKKRYNRLIPIMSFQINCKSSVKRDNISPLDVKQH